MPKQTRPTGKTRKASSFVVGEAGFAKISAVEGIQLEPAMKARATEAARQGLSADQRRARIISAYRKA